MANNAIIEYNASINLNNGELISVLFENLADHPSIGLFAGRVYWNTGAGSQSEDLYIYSGSAWIGLGDMYNHPTYHASGGLDINFDDNGARVLAAVSITEEGHVDAMSTRLMTLADLGYTGAADANNYVHWKRTDAAGTIDLNSNLSGNKVIASLQVNDEGHVVTYTTRSMTAADVGAAVINDSTISSTEAWSSTKISSEIAGALTGALVHKGGYNAATNSPALAGSPSGIKQGFTYVVTNSGTFNSIPVQVGDMIVADTDNPTNSVDSSDSTLLDDWTIVNKNIPDIVDASNSASGIIRLATNAQAIAGTSITLGITPATLVAFADAQESALGHVAEIGNGTATAFNISHSLATTLLIVDVFDKATGDNIGVQVTRTANNNVRIQTNTAIPTVSASDGYVVLIRKVTN